MSQRRRGSGDDGSATLWLAIFAIVLFFVVGLVYDGGLRISATREATNVAEEAARAGSQALAPGRVYDGSQGTLDPQGAIARAQGFLDSRGWTGTVEATPTAVTVTVTRSQALAFSQLWGATTATVTGHATAHPIRGYAT